MWCGVLIVASWIWYIMLTPYVTLLSRCLHYMRVTRHRCAYISTPNRMMESSNPLKKFKGNSFGRPQTRKLQTSAHGDIAEEYLLKDKMKLEEMSTRFGRNAEFNKLMYSDDNILMTLHVQLQNSKYTPKIDVSMDGTSAVCNYEVLVKGGETINGTVVASSKKVAKKDAARRILANLDHPTIEEHDEITKWMVSGHRSNIRAREEQASKDFGPVGHMITTRWTVGKDVFDGKGTSNSLKVAEMYALQDLYCQTQHLALAPQDNQAKGSLSKETTKAVTEPSKDSCLTDELSKGDASQMNIMRNNIANRMKVKQYENIIPLNGGFECTLTWTWTDASGMTQNRSISKHGTSKALAKAAASKAMMVEVGIIDPVSPQESAQATHIRNMIRTDTEKAVRLAADFLQHSNCSVWRLFLPQLMETLVQMCDQKLAAPILETLSRLDVKVPSDLWEIMISLASISIDESFCKKVLYSIRHLELDLRHFVSVKAMEYYKLHSWLISLELNAEICSNIQSIKERNGKDVPSILCNLQKTQLPLLFFSGETSPTYLKNPLKEDDMVLAVPHDGTYLWEKGILCTLSKHKTESSALNITCKVINKVNWETGDEIFEMGKFGIFHTTNTTTNKRMLQALHGITHRTVPLNSPSSGYRYNKDVKAVIIQGPEGALSDNKTDNVVLKTTVPLTDAQMEACKSAVVNTVTLIQGPPGTGKTQVACAIIDCWKRASPEKILAVADSNVAADNLIEALDKRGLTALRIGFGSDSLLQEESLKDLPRYERYRYLRSAGLHKEANSMWTLMIGEAVKKHQIIIATCIGSGNDILAGYSFPYVVIDECAQSIEASNLIPIGRDCKQLVLIGDHKQLRPTIISMDASKQGLSISLLERLASTEALPIHLLDVQRRMHPSISEFPNNKFYGGLLKDAVTVESRQPVKGFRWPSKGYNVAFIDASAGHPNGHFESVVGTSKMNNLEIDIVMMVLKSILDAGDAKESEIGILTPYDAQKWIIKRRIKQAMGDINSIEVDSVDGFQGKEKELIIFSAVRSNMQKEIGFLKDPRRMNVMLTRARRGLIVIADRYTIMNDHEQWRPYVDYVVDRGLDIHISELNKYLDTPSPALDDILNHVKTGSYVKCND